MSRCFNCRAPIEGRPDRCPHCRKHLRPFEWLKKPSGWSQLGGYLVGTTAVYLFLDGLHAAAVPSAVVAAVLLVLARGLHVRGR